MGLRRYVLLLALIATGNIFAADRPPVNIEKLRQILGSDYTAGSGVKASDDSKAVEEYLGRPRRGDRPPVVAVPKVVKADGVKGEGKEDDFTAVLTANPLVALLEEDIASRKK